MLNNERQQQILSCMESKNTITVKELTDQLYASPSTIRRDLSELEAQGFLKRIHGGAVLTAGSTLTHQQVSAVRSSSLKSSESQILRLGFLHHLQHTFLIPARLRRSWPQDSPCIRMSR